MTSSFMPPGTFDCFLTKDGSQQSEETVLCCWIPLWPSDWCFLDGLPQLYQLTTRATTSPLFQTVVHQLIYLQDYLTDPFRLFSHSPLFSYGAGGNASAHSSTIMSARKLEEADEAGKIAKVDKSLSKAIMQARTAKKMTQKELATAINEKPQVIGQYESGKAIPNPQIISKLEKKLGCKLPRPGKSSAPAKKKAGASGTTSGVAGKSSGLTRGGPPKRR